MKKLIVALVVLYPEVGAALAQQAAAAQPDEFVPMAPCRLLDTRLDPPANQAEENVRHVNVSSTRCGQFVSAQATGYMIRVSSVDRVIPADVPARPAVYGTQQRYQANAPLTFPVPGDRQIAVYIEGYYVPPGTVPRPTAAAEPATVSAAGTRSVGVPAAQSAPALVPRAELTGGTGSLDIDSGWGGFGFLGKSTTSTSPSVMLVGGDAYAGHYFGVYNGNLSELFRIEHNGQIRLVNGWSTLSGRTDYHESNTLPNNIVHNAHVPYPRDGFGGSSVPVTYFAAQSDSELDAPQTTKFLAITNGYYEASHTNATHINFDSQFYYSYPNFTTHYYYRAFSTGETAGGKATFWVRADSDLDAMHQTRADVYVSGRTGIGATNPLDRLHLLGSSPAIRVEDTNYGGSVALLANTYGIGPYLVSNTDSAGASTVAITAHRLRFGQGALAVDDAPSTAAGSPRSWTTRFQINDGGAVIVGNPASIAATEVLNVAGNINVSGNINAKFQDVAEWVPAATTLSPGTVVVLNPHQSNEVMASTAPYDTAVAGVVSAQPGVILGEGGMDKAKIATTGRVRVRVDATAHPVAIGDLLVTSSKPGMAMRSEPVDVGGTKMHRPGTLIGKALEPLADREGEILVLLSLQ